MNISASQYRFFLLVIFTLALIVPMNSAVASDFYFEPTVGYWYGNSDEASWNGVFGELTIWKEKKEVPLDWKYGIDTIAMYNNGDSDISDYEWDEKSIGIGPAIKFVSKGEDDFPWMMQCKIRLIAEHIDGNNDFSQYDMSQESYILNPYLEYTNRDSETWIWGVVGEGRISFSESIESSWIDEQSSDRDQGILSFFTQHDIYNQIAGRLTASALYTGWDDNTGIEVGAEARFKELAMLGMKYAIMDENNIITAYLRLEFGNHLRDLLP